MSPEPLDPLKGNFADHLQPPCRLKPRSPEAHKGDFGRVGIVAGSRSMSGAAILSGRSCLRGGAGLVHLFVPQSAHFLVAQGHPCYMVQPLPETPEGLFCLSGVENLSAMLEPMTAIAVGPGCGTGPGIAALLQKLLTRSGRLVIDADALNQLALMEFPWSTVKAEVILTPHPGEMKRLLKSLGLPQDKGREETARMVSRNTGATVLLKGHGTIVCNGDLSYLNPTGNPGMATGGCGDVLTGLIAAFWCQGLDAFQAASLGAWVHGHSADIKARELGQVSLLATDIIEGLPAAIEGVISP